MCDPGYSSSIRPSVDKTNQIKKDQMVQFNLPGTPADYEEDHFFPLSLGGAPLDRNNLWPEPKQQAAKSDPIELDLWHLLCADAITLSTARNAIIRYKRHYG